MITEFNNCFIIRSASLHSYLRHSLILKERGFNQQACRGCYFQQNKFRQCCTRVDNNHCLLATWWTLGQWRKIESNDNLLHFDCFRLMLVTLLWFESLSGIPTKSSPLKLGTQNNFLIPFDWRIQNIDQGPWTTTNFQKEIVPVNMKIYRRSGYEKHRLVFIAYTLEGLSRKSGLLWDLASIILFRE